MIKKPVIGISGCLGGSAVRFNGQISGMGNIQTSMSGNGYRAASSASCSTTCALEARKYTDVFQPRPE